jgi:hypothetical protein
MHATMADKDSVWPANNSDGRPALPGEPPANVAGSMAYATAVPESQTLQQQLSGFDFLQLSASLSSYQPTANLAALVFNQPQANPAPVQVNPMLLSQLAMAQLMTGGNALSALQLAQANLMNGNVAQANLINGVAPQQNLFVFPQTNSNHHNKQPVGPTFAAAPVEGNFHTAPLHQLQYQYQLQLQGRCQELAMDMDEGELSSYQCLVRKQIELFEATEADLNASAQGRNKPIILGQVGIRCRHCATFPPAQRAKGAVYFPSQLKGLYQTAQNMSNEHILKDCREVPRATREALLKLREKKNKRSTVAGGRTYWTEGLRVLGVVETEDRRLRFRE